MFGKFRFSKENPVFSEQSDRSKNIFDKVFQGIKNKVASQSGHVMMRRSFLLYLFIMVALCMNMRLDFGYRVVVNGQSFGTVPSRKIAEKAIWGAYDAIVATRGTDYKFEKASFHLVPVSKDRLETKETVQDKISSAFDGLVSAYGIIVDGKVVTALEVELEGYDALREIEAQYKNENNEAHYTNEVTISRCRVQPAMVVSKEEAIAVLTGTRDAVITHRVQEGETFSSIALEYGVGTQELMDANPGIQPELLQMGENITVSAPQPIIAVETVEQITVTETIPYKVKEQKDSSMYKGNKKTLTEGVNGKKDVVYEITRVNNTVTKKVALSETVLSEPVTEVVAVGTKAKATNSATGVMMRPYGGTITARFGASGSRWARNHTGIDYAGSTGDSIKAADGGKVTFAGWNGSYGKMVKISHGNGLETWYAHMSKIYVSAGQKVSKGTSIGAIGSTGNSTGPHLHFEVRKNGVAKNPSNYVK